MVKLLAEMETKGIKVNKNYLMDLSKKFQNRIENIDSSLLRSGRFDLLLETVTPDNREIKEILDLKIKSKGVTIPDISKIQNRNLPPRITDQEKQLHEEFIETLGENSIWKKTR